MQLLETLKSTTLCPFSEVDVQFPEPPNFRVAVNWLGVLLSTQFQDYMSRNVKECQHVLRQRSKTPSSWVAGIMSFPQKMQKQNMKHDFCCVSPGNQRGFWIPKRMIRKPTCVNRKTKRRESNNNQTITFHTALRNWCYNLLTVQKWWSGRTFFEPKTIKTRSQERQTNHATCNKPCNHSSQMFLAWFWKSKISTSCCFHLVHLRQLAEQPCHYCIFSRKLPKWRHEQSSTCRNRRLKWKFEAWKSSSTSENEGRSRRVTGRQSKGAVSKPVQEVWTQNSSLFDEKVFHGEIWPEMSRQNPWCQGVLRLENPSCWQENRRLHGDGPSSTQQWFPSLICVLSHICGGSGGSGPHWSSTLIHWIFWGTVGQMSSNRRSDVTAGGTVGWMREVYFFLPLKWAELRWQAIAARNGLQIPGCLLKRL